MTPNKEDYLKCIYEIGTEEGKISNKEIANRMQVSPPAVTEMIKKLISEDLIIKDQVKGYLLTKTGKINVAELYRKHRLIEVFLVDHLQYTCDLIHQEAEILEHTVSDHWCPQKKETRRSRKRPQCGRRHNETAGSWCVPPFLSGMISVYQTNGTIIWTLTVGQGILRVINGTFYAPQHKDDPPAEQKPVKGVPRADKPGHIPPLGGIVPHLGVQQAAADCPHRQLQPADAGCAQGGGPGQRQRCSSQLLQKAEAGPARCEHRPVGSAPPGQLERSIGPAAQKKQ